MTDEALDIASVDLALSTTRSVRRRIDWERPIDPSVIEACIDVATQAPTGRNAENWRFLVLTEEEPKQRVAELYRRATSAYQSAAPTGQGPKSTVLTQAERLHEMPALILVCAEGRPDPSSPAMQVAHYGSVLPAAWSLMVALRARRIGSTWTSLLLLHEQEAAKALGIPEGVSQTVLLPVGYMKDAKLKPAERKPAGEVTYWNRWGQRR